MTWGRVGREDSLNSFDFNPNNDPVGINPDVVDTLSHCNPFDYFKLFVTSDHNRYDRIRNKSLRSTAN